MQPFTRATTALVVALAVALGAPTMVAAAAEKGPGGDSWATWDRRVTRYYLTGDNADAQKCGRELGGAFVLAGTSRRGDPLRCVVPRGMPVLAVPSAYIVLGSSGDTRRQLEQWRDEGLDTVTRVRTKVDGRPVPVRLVAGDAYVIRYRGGGRDRVATGTFLSWIRHLSPGRHKIRVSSIVEGKPESQSYRVRVRHR